MAEDNAETRILYDSPDFRVRFQGGGISRICFVTFDSLTDTPDLERDAFAEHFLREHRIDAVHVINRTNVWYAYDDFDAALEQIRRAVKRYQRVLTYGSSMGGYAAIRWAQTLGARTAIAISPQYSVSKRLAPFEHRWSALVRGISSIENEPRHGSLSVTPIVFYDPADRDALHFDLIKANYPSTLAVAMRHSGHPAGAMLSETRLLSKAILSIVSGSFDEAEFERLVRGRRQQSGQYLFTLARRLGPTQMRLKCALAAAAVRANRDGAYMIYAGLLAERAGDTSRCEAHLREAAALLRDHPAALRALTALAIRRCRIADSVEFAKRLCGVNSQPRYRRMLAVAFALAGRMDEAREEASKIPDYVLRLSLSRPLVAVMPSNLLSWWWSRHYGIEAEFIQVDSWQERLKLRRLRASTQGVLE